MSYLPTAGKTYWMWFNRRLMTVRRVPNQAPGIQLQKSETLQIRILAFSHRYLATLLEESRSEYRIAKEGVIAVFASNTMSNWVNITSNPKRALHTIILDPGVKEMLLDDARDFLRSQQWYTERGIPFRRGYLLYGAPGSGKTSMIQSIAGELGLDVYIVSLSRSGLDDNGLYQLMGGLPKRCIALMEDIDAAFKQGISRDLPPSIVKSTEGDGASSSPHTLEMSQKMAQASGVTLSGLLNALDGIGAQEGRLLFATTNDYSALDPALRRPGRMDVHVEFKLASKYQAEELFKCFFTPSVLRTAPPTAGVSGSSFDKDPGCGPDDISDLAKQFSEAIPERAISMASLQGHLMRYKLQPHDAVLATPKWVDEELGAPTTKSNPS